MAQTRYPYAQRWGLQLPNSPKSSLQTLASRSRILDMGRIRKPAVEWNNADEIDDGQDEPLEASDDDGQDSPR